MKLLNKVDQDFIVEVEGFSGPFDLLLHLVDEKELDLYEIQISTITSDYLEYIRKMESLNLSVAAEFIYMASFLIELKSRMLIPNTNHDLDLPEDLESEKALLLERLIEYKKFKNLSGFLAGKQEDFSLRHTRKFINKELIKNMTPEKPNIEIKDANVLNLVKAFNRAMKRLQESQRDYSAEIQPELFSIREKIDYIVERIFNARSSISLSELMVTDNKYELIANFLAILELFKEGIITVRQDDPFEDIELIPVVNKKIEFDENYYKYQEIEEEENE